MNVSLASEDARLRETTPLAKTALLTRAATLLIVACHLALDGNHDILLRGQQRYGRFLRVHEDRR